MSKNIIIIISILICIFFIPICISEEQDENTNQELVNDTENFNQTDENNEIEELFKNYSLENVIILGDLNYTEEIKKYDSLYLLFYSPWNDKCKEFIPLYKEFIDYCKEKNLGIQFARIDATVHENSTFDFQLSSLPGIYFIYKGKRNAFQDEITKERLIYFTKRKMSEDVFEIKKLEELKSIKNFYNTSLILLSTVKDKNTNIYKSFSDFANKAPYIDFFSCLSDECYKKYGEDIILFKEFDEKENRYFSSYGRLEDAQIGSVRNFTGIYAIETGAFVTQHDINLCFEFKKKVLFYIRNSSIPEYTKYDYLFKKLGKELRPYDIYSFISSPDGNDLQKSIVNAFSIDISDELPGIFFYDPFCDKDPYANIQIFSIRHLDVKKLNFNFVKKFIKDIKDKKIKRDLFSELLDRRERYYKGIKYVFGKTFDKDVIEEENNVLLGMIDGFGSESEIEFINILGNLTEKYQNDADKKIRFSFININNNEPRDIVTSDYDYPRAYLYTNAMDKKEIIKYIPKNLSEPTYEEFETFLFEKLNWKNETKTNKENIEDKNEDL